MKVKTMITNRDKQFMEILFEKAKSEPETFNVHIVSCIVLKKGLYIFGTNHNKTDPMALRFGKNEEALYIHAEIDACKKAINYFKGDYEKLKDSTIYIMRAKKDVKTKKWMWGNAKPCCGCMKAIEFFGFKKVIYSKNGINEYGEI